MAQDGMGWRGTGRDGMGVFMVRKKKVSGLSLRFLQPTRPHPVRFDRTQKHMETYVKSTFTYMFMLRRSD